MRTIDLCAAVALCIVPSSLLAADEVSVERGLYLSIIGGCHFCHTEGYREADGKIDPEKALKGSSIGWQGPWGTTYAANLRDSAMGFTEDKWVDHLKNKVNFSTVRPVRLLEDAHDVDCHGLVGHRMCGTS